MAQVSTRPEKRPLPYRRSVLVGRHQNADDAMIKHAVRRHFDDIDDDLVTNYFDNLIQLPIRVPALGTQGGRTGCSCSLTRAVSINRRGKEFAHSETWQGKRVYRAFLQTLHATFSGELIGQFDTADRLAPLMATASGVAGNPRLVKRFLNALAIPVSIPKAHGVGADEAVLANILLFDVWATRRPMQP